jgi:hypothetical protein
MMKWLKMARFIITAPGWVKALLLVPLLLILLLLPVLGIVVVVLLLVLGLVWLLVSPVRALADRIK